MTDKMFSIQSKLLTLEGYSVFATSIRMAAKNDLEGCLQMIRDQAKDNRVLVEKIIGAELLKEIESNSKAVIKPVRIQRSRKAKQISPNGLPIRYVGRPSKFGNPFKPGMFTADGVWISEFSQAVDLFREYLETNLNYDPEWINELKGKNLSCWCKLDCCCHADVLIEKANNF